MENLTVLQEAAGMRADALDIVWHDRPRPIAPEAQAYIDQRWDVYAAEAQARGKILFNGPITCLRAASAQVPRMRLQLEPADYKTFVVTVLRDRAWFLEHAPEAMTPALGNSVLLTHGDEALLAIRSHRVSAYPGRAHLIGGVLEKLGTPELPATAQGILAHLRREMAEEAGINDHDLCGLPKLLALVRDDFLAQPELIWQWELNLPIAHIGRRIVPHEHIGWLPIGTTIAISHWHQMTPVARAACERRQPMQPRQTPPNP